MDTLRASSAQYLALCPGRYRAEQGLPERVSADGAAERGTRIHAIVAAMLTGKDLEVVEDADDLEAASECVRRIRALFAEHGTVEDVICEEHIEAIGWSGHPDAYALMSDASAVLIDVKSGWGDVPDPSVNAQLRVYAAMLWAAHDLHPIVATIIKPHGAPITPTVYNDDALALATHELAAIREACLAPDARRCPSAQACKWCRAHGTNACPETLALPSRALAVLPEAASNAHALAPAKLAQMLRLIDQIEPFAKIVKAEAKARLMADPSAVPGYKLKPNAGDREIESMTAVLLKLGNVLTEGEILAACKPSAPGLTKAVKVKEGLKNDKAAEARLAELLGESMTRSDKAPSVVAAGE